jgi:hypothetical protein
VLALETLDLKTVGSALQEAGKRFAAGMSNVESLEEKSVGM